MVHNRVILLIDMKINLKYLFTY